MFTIMMPGNAQKTLDHVGNVCICEWFFKCKCYGDISEFNGVSIITFNDENKIVLLKEYKSETQDIFPYE